MSAMSTFLKPISPGDSYACTIATACSFQGVVHHKATDMLQTALIWGHCMQQPLTQSVNLTMCPYVGYTR